MAMNSIEQQNAIGHSHGPLEASFARHPHRARISPINNFAVTNTHQKGHNKTSTTPNPHAFAALPPPPSPYIKAEKTRESMHLFPAKPTYPLYRLCIEFLIGPKYDGSRTSKWIKNATRSHDSSELFLP